MVENAKEKYASECGSNVCVTNGKPIDHVDCFKYFGLQVAADGGCGTENKSGV